MKKVFSGNLAAKKVIAMLLCMAICFAMIPFSAFATATTPDIWDGTVADGYASGTGTETDPYIIETGAQLARMITNDSFQKYYKLANDIYLNDITKIDWATGKVEEGYTPNSWYTYGDLGENIYFSSNFDGDGHVIYGLYADVESGSVALFPKTTSSYDSAYKNLGIDKAYISSTNSNAAAFFGWTKQTGNKTISMENCYVGADVTIKGKNAAVFYAYGCHTVVMDKCYTLATVSGTTTYGAIADNWGSVTIKNSYIANTIASNKKMINCENVYVTDGSYVSGTVSVISAANMQGLDALTNAGKMAGLAACDAFVATETYPILNLFVPEVVEPDVPVEDEIKVWDGTVADGYASGTGTEADPYIIETGAQLARVIKNDSFQKYYKLANDIYLNDITKIDWATGEVEEGYTPNSWYTYSDLGENVYFNSNFDGDGHVIYGLYVDVESGSTSLFPKTSSSYDSTYKNIGIDKAYISSTNSNAAAFFGWTKQTGNKTISMENCYVGSDVTIKGKNAGVFYGFGCHTLVIDKCYTLATVTGTTTYGAIADNWHSVTIKNSYIANTKASSKSNINCTNVYVIDGSFVSGSVTVISAENMQGLDALTNAGKMAGLAASEAFVATETYPILKAFVPEVVEPDVPVEDEIKVWDGVTKTAPTKGSGTEADPFLIETAEELASIITNVGGNYYKLANDIYLNDVDKINWETGEKQDENYTPNTWYTSATLGGGGSDKIFYGNLDGDGHVIYGLYANTTDAVNVSLFPRTQDNNAGTIKNIGIDKAYLSTGGRVSAFFASVNAVGGGGALTIENCYVGEKVTLSGTNASPFYSYGQHNITMSNCYSLAKVTGTGKVGILAENWGSSTISNSYAINVKVSAHSAVACTNVYATTNEGFALGYTVRTVENMQGLDALTNAGKMAGLAACDAFVATETYPILKVFAPEGYEPEVPDVPVEDEIKVWDGTVATNFASGSGLETDPYIIKTAEQLARAVKRYEPGKYFKLNNDIYLNELDKIDWATGKVLDATYTPNTWFDNTQISEVFCSNFDGDGHVIYGLYANTTEAKNVSLFPKVQDCYSGIFQKIGIDKAYISTGANASAFFAFNVGSNNSGILTIENCYVGKDVTIKGQNATIFYAYGGHRFNISKCYSLATVEGVSQYGLIGETWGDNRTISYTYVANTIVSKHNEIQCNYVYVPDGTNAKGNSYLRTAENMQGAGALSSAMKMSGLAFADGAFIATASYPVLSAFPYRPETFKINFNANGGILTTEFIEDIATAVVEFPTPVKAGFIFKAWYTDDTFKTLASNIMPGEEVTYYAKWYVKYDANNDSEKDTKDLVALVNAILAKDFTDDADFSFDGADCNSDTVINLLDLVVIKKVFAGSYTSNIPEGYRLVWSEQFASENYSDVWEKHLDTKAGTTATLDNISVENGALNMSVTYDAATGKYVVPSNLSTGNSMNFKRGYVEIKAKLPYISKGEWPAIWMLPTIVGLSHDRTSGQIKPQYNVEIDMIENTSLFKQGYSELHYWHINNAEMNKSSVLTNGSYTNYYTFADTAEAADWHVYGMLWTETAIKFYLDGKLYCTYTIPEDDQLCFNVYMSLILSNNYDTTKADAGYFAQNGSIDMTIDYIRIFQNPETDSILIK